MAAARLEASRQRIANQQAGDYREVTSMLARIAVAQEAHRAIAQGQEADDEETMQWLL